MPSRQMGKKLGLLASLLFGMASLALAQNAQDGPFRLASVKYVGLSRYTEAQANAEIGLRLGNTITMAQLQAASDRLSDSGAFDSVTYRYSTRGNELSAEFKVQETDKVLPCAFDNFVWFSDQQLDQALRARVPFYTGVTPVNGTTSKEIAAALEQLLHTSGVSGTVEQIASADHPGAPISALLFTVKGVDMPMRSVTFPGASAIPEGELVIASSQLMGQDYSASNVSVFGKDGLLPLYGRHGYLRAHFEKPQAKVAGSSANRPSQDIAVTLPVQEGFEYYWQKADWNGNQQLPAVDLDQLLGMKAREVANKDKIDAGFAAVKRAYGTKGFIDVSVEPKMLLDDASKSVSYDVTIAEGTQYHLAQVHFGGLPDRAAEELAKKWQLKPGDIYNATYVDEFVKSIAWPAIRKMGIQAKSVAINSQRDKQAASVQLNIVFH
jgi:outer membrane protein assembly factor BamA